LNLHPLLAVGAVATAHFVRMPEVNFVDRISVSANHLKNLSGIFLMFQTNLNKSVPPSRHARPAAYSSL